MAITKLMHFKESKQGLSSFHLQNAIKYILNPEKTQDGALVGGNVKRRGESPSKVLREKYEKKIR